jgi:DNA-binding MarR family transcriptional regulator
VASFEFGLLSLRIGRILVAERREHWTYEIADKVKVNRGSAHRVLRQFEGEGWVTNRMSPGEKKTVRVIYEVTRAGAIAISAALAPFQIAPAST